MQKKLSVRQAETLVRVFKNKNVKFLYKKDADKEPHELLSDREFQVLCMIGTGKTVTEISKELSLSDKTISTYRARILEKMRMKTNADLTFYAISNKLVKN